MKDKDINQFTVATDK